MRISPLQQYTFVVLIIAKGLHDRRNKCYRSIINSNSHKYSIKHTKIPPSPKRQMEGFSAAKDQSSTYSNITLQKDNSIMSREREQQNWDQTKEHPPAYQTHE